MRRAAASSAVAPVYAGLLLAAAFYVPLPLLPFVAFLPLLCWLDATPGRPWRATVRGGALFGAVAFGIGVHFFVTMVRFSWLALLLYVGFVLLISLRVGLTIAWLGWLRRRTGLSYGLLLPATWVPVEWLQTFGDLRMSGDHVSLSLAQYPFLIQIADVAGPYGLGAFLLAVNGLLHDAWSARGDRRRHRVALAALVAVVVGYDAWAWTRPPASGETLRVGIVQPSVRLLEKHDNTTAAEQREKLARLSREARALGATWIVWPESARPEPIYHWDGQPATYRADDVAALARELDATILFGVEYVKVRSREDYDLYNAAMAVDPEGTLGPSWYGKRYLVPFAERTPFRGVLGRFVDGRGGEWKWLAGGFEPGPTLAPVDVHGVRVGALVCFEQLFPTPPRRLRQAGAQFHVVVTNDAWFGRTLFQRHLAHAVRLRAVETRSHYVRAANTGISGFYDEKGRLFEASGLYVEDVLVRDVVRTDGRTPYVRFGEVAVGLLLAGLALAHARALRNPLSPSAS